MTRAVPTTAVRYAAIIQTVSVLPGVAVGAGRKKGFGAAALATRGRIFAMLASGDRFVVKLPKTRVETLIAAGIGTSFHASRGRVMKEWLMVNESHDDWLALANEAHAFVSATS